MRRRIDLETTCQIIAAEIRAAGYGLDTCVLAARMSVFALREIGMRAEAIHARVIVSNPVMAERIDRGDPPPTDETKAEWLASGAWQLAVGYGPNPNERRPGYDGHVVVVAGTGRQRWLLDPTAPQASRPHHDIHIPPLALPMDPDARGVEDLWDPLSVSVNGSRVTYRFDRRERSFIRAGDWRNLRPNDKTVRAIVTRTLAEAVNRPLAKT